MFYTKAKLEFVRSLDNRVMCLESRLHQLETTVMVLENLDKMTKEILTQYKKSLEAAHINAEVSASKSDKLETRIGLLELSNFAHTAAKKRTRVKKSRA